MKELIESIGGIITDNDRVQFNKAGVHNIPLTSDIHMLIRGIYEAGRSAGIQQQKLDIINRLNLDNNGTDR